MTNTQKIIIIISSITLFILTIVNYSFRNFDTFFASICCLMLLSLLYNVRTFAPVVISLTCLYILTTNISNPFPLYSSMIAIALWGIYDNHHYALVATIIEILLNTTSWIVENMGEIQSIISAVIIFDSMIFASFYIGQSMQWKEEARKTEQLHHDLEISVIKQNYLQTNQELIREIHDLTTSHLTYIILLTQLDINAKKYKQYNLDIQTHAEKALEGIHKAIFILKTIDMNNFSDSNNQNQNAEMLITKYDDMLANAGFSGKGEILGTLPNFISNDTRIIHIINEIYTNILRRGSINKKFYSVTLTITNSTLSILSSNSIGNNSIGGKSGLGLYECRKIVKSLNGKLYATTNEDEWIIQIRIPIKSID